MKAFPKALLIGLCAYSSAFGQGYYDSAIRFGQTSIFGSTRSMGMGGVQMAIGADGAAGAVNPASPAMLRRSEIQFSLMPIFTTSNSTFLKNEISSTNSSAPVGSFSVALSNMKEDKETGDFRGGTFSLSYTRTAHNDYLSSWEGSHLLSPRPGDTLNSAASGYNSLISYYLDNVNKPGLYPSDVLRGGPFGNGIDDIIMAYATYILDVDKNQFISVVPLGNVRQKGYWNQSQSQSVWNFGYSFNWKDRIYVGANLGIYRGNTSDRLQYTELQETVVVNPNNPNYSYLQGFKGFNFAIDKSLSQKAKGVNGNIGVLAKVTDGLRLAASVQFPTYNNMRETYDHKVTANYNGIPYWYNMSDPNDNLYKQDTTALTNNYAWNLSIPARYRFGASYIFGKSGMIGVDLEYTDLSKSKLKNGDGGYNFLDENAVIKSNYKSTLNVKVGGEFRVEDFRIRLGYAWYPSPLKSGSPYTNNIPGDKHYFTGGLGGRYESWFWDAAVVLGFWNTQYTYVPEVMPNVRSKINSTQIRIGAGFNF